VERSLKGIIASAPITPAHHHTTTMTTPMNWKTRNLRRLIKSVVWAASTGLVAWWLGFQPTWPLLALVFASMFIDNILDAWLPSADDDKEHAQALVAAEQAGYQRGLAEANMRSYTTGKPA
jgi:hypothetical protein